MRVIVVLDIFRFVLRCCQSVQAAAHLHREGNRTLQGQETPRDAAPCLCNRRHGIQKYATRWATDSEQIIIVLARSCFICGVFLLLFYAILFLNSWINLIQFIIYYIFYVIILSEVLT